MFFFNYESDLGFIFYFNKLYNNFSLVENLEVKGNYGENNKIEI